VTNNNEMCHVCYTGDSVNWLVMQSRSSVTDDI